MMRLLRASLLKLIRRPATRRALLVLVALLVVIYLPIGMTAGANADARTAAQALLTFPDAYSGLAALLLSFVAIAGAGYAGTVAASEWSWSTFRAALARGESRVRYVVGLFVAIGLLAIVAWLVLFVLGTGAILVASALGGVPAGDPLSPATSAAVLIACGGWALLMEIGIGFCVSFVFRSAVAGVGTVVGLMLVEQMAAMTSIPADLLRLAPWSAAANLVSTAGEAGLDAAIVVPLLVTTFYMVLSIAIAAAVARRAEVA